MPTSPESRKPHARWKIALIPLALPSARIENHALCRIHVVDIVRVLPQLN
jgi:hypothetical protein